MIKNYKLWRGLFAVFCVLFVTVIFLTSLAFLRHGDINTFLGIEAPRQAVITEDTNYYPSDYPVVVQSGETEAEAQARVGLNSRKTRKRIISRHKRKARCSLRTRTTHFLSQWAAA